jgi:isoleucyl-tRNA synthetase
VEKKLGLSSKTQIEEYGVAEFNARCRESVFRYLKEWNELTERIGYWVDLEHPYVTMNNTYIESVWWAIKQMWEKTCSRILPRSAQADTI